MSDKKNNPYSESAARVISYLAFGVWRMVGGHGVT